MPSVLDEFNRPLACGNEDKNYNGVLDSGDDVTKRIVTSYLKYRKTTLTWTRVSEGGYLAARDLGFDYPTG